ncbi:hypothetical protein [Jiella marina]|uniref:hypothetical protein n=1 Tax=Jiella sp. LLJ827 TaxID=2917712 RepID=UPI002101AA4E|nr:hypothetical protein [Jiella sp. LLJ827]MCQ0990587.1 hypothetical protein [Jiella sp. LLJ827]
MKLSAGKAAETVGVTTPTITKAIKSGRLSAERTEDGKGWLIDPAELCRVFPPLNGKSAEKGKALGSETPKDTAFTATLEAELKALRERFDDFRAMSDRERDELRRDRDRWHEQATGALRQLGEVSQTLKIIEDRREEAEKSARERPKGLAGWFTRKSA